MLECVVYEVPLGVRKVFTEGLFGDWFDGPALGGFLVGVPGRGEGDCEGLFTGPVFGAGLEETGDRLE